MNENEMMQGDEISLFDLVNTMIEGWKMWVATTLIGVVIGLGVWSQQGYRAELIANTRSSLDLTAWNAYTASLPALAEQRLNAAGGSGENAQLLRAMAQPAWWRTQVTPNFLLTKGDVRDLPSVSKEILEAGATSIQRLTIRTEGANQADARRNVVFVENFIREGALFLALKALVNRYDLEVAVEPATLRQQVSTIERELIFLGQRAESLEALRKQFPQRSEALLAQVFDPKDSGAKFLPLETQIIAVKTDINAAREQLDRTRLRLAELDLYRKFIDQATPLLATTANGFELAEALKVLEQSLRKNLDPTDGAGLLAIDTIARDLESTTVGVGSMFMDNPLILTSRPKLSMPLVLGLIGGLFAGVLWVFVGDAWRRARAAREAG